MNPPLVHAIVLVLASANPTAQEVAAPGAVCGGAKFRVVTPTPGTEQATSEFIIDPDFDDSVHSAERHVLLYAVSEWEAVILTPAQTVTPYPIAFAFAPLDPGKLAQTTTSGTADGALYHSAITFSANVQWFVDPTPDEDSEFGSGGPNGYDLLTVARHEIGHSVGYFTAPPVTSLVSNGTFDPEQMNIPWTDAGGGHTDPDYYPDDLMAPYLSNGERHPIELYFHGALVGRAWRYGVAMGFVDPQFQGVSDGSANAPWSTLEAALFNEPSGKPLLLRPETHGVSPIVVGRAGRFQVVRGGSAILR